MKAYMITTSRVLTGRLMVYLSLRELCKQYGLYYTAAVKGKRIFKRQSTEIIEVNIIGRRKRGSLINND